MPIWDRPRDANNAVMNIFLTSIRVDARLHFRFRLKECVLIVVTVCVVLRAAKMLEPPVFATMLVEIAYIVGVSNLSRVCTN